MKITELSIQKKTKGRCNVYIDGAFVCGLDNFTVLKNGLKVGLEISGEKLEELQFESERDKALNYAFGYLSKYRKTEKELRAKLVERGYLVQIVDYVMVKTKEYKFVDDESYVNSYVETYKKRKGSRLMKFELKRKGIDEEIVSNIEVNEQEEQEYVKALIEKFFRNKEMTKENVQKLYRHLLSKGFSYDSAKSALYQVMTETELDDEE